MSQLLHALVVLSNALARIRIASPQRARRSVGRKLRAVEASSVGPRREEGTMRQSRSSAPALRIALAFCLAALALPASAQQHAVSRVTIVVKPRVYSGTCPTSIEFAATIYVSHRPVFVDFEWEHSDGGHSSPQRIEISGAWHRVTETWKVGTPGQRRNVWAKLRVLAPTSLASSQAVVELNCR